MLLRMISPAILEKGPEIKNMKEAFEALPVNYRILAGFAVDPKTPEQDRIDFLSTLACLRIPAMTFILNDTVKNEPPESKLVLETKKLLARKTNVVPPDLEDFAHQILTGRVKI